MASGGADSKAMRKNCGVFVDNKDPSGTPSFGTGLMGFADWRSKLAAAA
jgi:hypothetical protein